MLNTFDTIKSTMLMLGRRDLMQLNAGIKPQYNMRRLQTPLKVVSDGLWLVQKFSDIYDEQVEFFLEVMGSFLCNLHHFNKSHIPNGQSRRGAHSAAVKQETVKFLYASKILRKS